MSISIRDLNIKKFRGIRELTLSDFNHINILTGDNNSGKTSVLEILKNIERPRDFISILDMTQTHSRKSIYKDIFGIFPLDSDSIEYDYKDNQDSTHNVIFTKKDILGQLPEKEKYRLQGFLKTGSPKIIEDNIVDVKGIELVVNCDNKKNTQTIYDFQRVFSFPASTVGIPVSLVSSVAHADMMEFDELLKDNNLHIELLEILKNFDATIFDIFMSEKECFIRSSLYEQAIPLSLYGDGLKKALVILANLLKAQNGILLVDEFETAIHTSAMGHVFSMILEAAEKYNVQIFMTSHSKEAIETVLKSKSYSEKINHYTLYKNDGKTFARKLSCKEALELNEKGMELRG